MVSRPLIISCLAAASSIHGGVAADPPRRPLRGPSRVDGPAPTGGGGIPYAAAARRRARSLQDNAIGAESASIFDSGPQDDVADADATVISESAPQDISGETNAANIFDSAPQESLTGADDVNIFEDMAIAEDDEAATEEDAITAEDDATTVEEETPIAVVDDAATVVEVDDTNIVEVPPESTAVEVVVEIPVQCLSLLAASANENGVLKKDNYFTFTDGMSNGYFKANNMTEYNDLPVENKFAYVTLTCQCHAMGGRGNCCQGARAKLDVAGIEEPETMSAQLQNFVNDICSVTAHVIGDNRLPVTARPTTSAPTTSPPTAGPTPSPTTGPTAGPTRPPSARPTPGPTNVPTRSPSAAPSGGPTASPSASAEPSAAPFDVTPDRAERVGEGGGEDDDGTLGTGAWVGIGIAIAVLLCLCCSLCVFLVRRKREEKGVDDESRVMREKEQKVHNMRDEYPDKTPDTGNSALTDGGATGSTVPGAAAHPAASNLLLPDMRGDGNGFIGEVADPGAIEEGVAVRSPGAGTNTPDADASTLAASNLSRNTPAIGNDPAGQSDINQID